MRRPELRRSLEVEQFLLTNNASLFLYNYLKRFYDDIDTGDNNKRLKTIIAPIDAAINRLSQATNKTVSQISNSKPGTYILANHISTDIPNFNDIICYTAFSGQPIHNELMNKISSKIINKIIIGDLTILIADAVMHLDNQLNDLKNYVILKTVLAGPYALEKLVSQSNNRIIYIFYDYHGKPSCTPKSTSIVAFVDSLLKEPRNYIIDFMVEASIKDVSTQSEEKSHLYGLRFLLKDCYSKDRSKCLYNNTRVHWTDVRLDESLINYFQIGGLIEESRKYPPSYYNDLGINILDLNQKLLGMLRTQNSRFDLDLTLKESKIIKQINNIANETDRAALLMEIKNKTRWSFDKLVQLTERPNQVYVDTKISEAILKFTALFTDAYMISRMLRNFGNYAANNIILYAGGAHSENISRILKDLGYIVKSSVGLEQHEKLIKGEESKDFQCLDVTEMLPMFN